MIGGKIIDKFKRWILIAIYTQMSQYNTDASTEIFYSSRMKDEYEQL